MVLAILQSLTTTQASIGICLEWRIPMRFISILLCGIIASWGNSGSTLSARFPPPAGFERVPNTPHSFGEYLRTLPLKPPGSPVLYYNGEAKSNPNIYVAVVDLPIGKKDLHQCADAVMRLFAEYFYQQKMYEKIHFNFISDSKPRYYLDYVKGDTSRPTFWKYMEYIFASANTRSLQQELKPVPKYTDMRIGDVFIQTGNPYGHAILIVDVAKNPKTGETVFLLAQSYMPAQETQILSNQNDDAISPWYALDTLNPDIYTPEWLFHQKDLRRHKDITP